MVLSGTVKEFILADVCNLLSQQKITGRLVLTDGKIEGGIVFREGIIVGADNGDENLPNKLFNYMTDIKRTPPEHLSALFNSHAGNLSVLATTMVERGMIEAKELKSFAELCVEDICCALLSWDYGTYRFNSLRSIGTLACGSVTIPVESIIMEGMRRADEWGRMREYILEDMIFVPATKGAECAKEFDVDKAPEEYVFSLLDGSNTVGSIKSSSCLCEYRVYESINILLQSQRITALHQKYTKPIQAALRRKDAEEASVLGKTFLGSLLSVAVAAAFVAFFLFCRFFLLPELFGPGSGGGGRVSPNAVFAEELLRRAVGRE